MRSFGSEPVSLEQEALLLGQIVSFVTARRLEVPAVFLLELTKPLSFITSQAVVLASPVLGALLGLPAAEALYWVLEDRARVEKLIQSIEEAARVAPSDQPSKPD
jgi:hypothetical protein